MMGLLGMSDLQNLLDEVIRERDELIDRLESCRMALDDMTEHAEEFKAEVRRMKEERDEARKATRFFRDLYVSQVGRTYPEEYTLPWEGEK
jgi:uncharacterized coiled-coil DUF342 family protein